METRLLRMGCALVCVLFVVFAATGFGQQGSPQAVNVQPLIVQPIDESRVVTLKGNTHPLAQPQFDIGVAAPNLPLQRMLLVLNRSPQQEHALRTLLDSQQDKNSPNYHKWQSPVQFGTQFGASDQDIQLISGWLQSHGFQISRVSNGRSIIEFSGSEAQVEGAFDTQIHRYVLPNGEQHWANAGDPQIPAALAQAVAGVWSLHDFRKQPRIQMLPQMLKTKYTPGQQPDTTLTGLNGTIHALSPADYATIYNINPVYASGNYGGGCPGQGCSSIAVVGRSDLFNGGEDIINFDQVFMPQFCCYSIQTVFNGPDPGDLGGVEEAEATLDVTWSGAIAPYTRIYNMDFVVSASTNTTDGVDLSEMFIIDNNLASIMTESFGSCEGFASSAEAQGISMLAEQAAAEGITYIVSSGDSGAAGCDDPGLAPGTHGQSVNVLASTPFNLAIGGTQFNEGNNPTKYWSSQNSHTNLGSALSYIPEDAWNESCSSCTFPNLASSGGGASQYNSKPTWQFGVAGIPNDGARDVPDVALTASAANDPYILCLEGSCIPDQNGFISLALIGGTSASAPSFAGIMSLVQAANGSQGLPNYILYKLAAGENWSQCDGSNASTAPASSCVFNDVTSGSNTVPGVQGFSASAGYDLATGLGSVNVANLVNKWSTVSFIGTTTTLSPASITATHGSAVTLNVSVSPTSGNGVPTGDVALIPGINGWNNRGGMGAGFFTLSNGTASAQVRNLPGGSYSLSAQYAGDATLAPSAPSNPVNVNISPEPSTIGLSILDRNGNPFTSGPYGSFLYVRADVKGSSGFGTPTGPVGFLIFGPGNNNSNFSAGLNSQGNTALPGADANFPVGQSTISAYYNGDPSFGPSTSSSVSISVTQASTTTFLESAGAPQGAVLTATVSTASLASPPTGTVTFYSGANSLGSATVMTANGPLGVMTTATLTATQLANGQSTLTATYGGDTNYTASTSFPTNINLQPDFVIQPSSEALVIAAPGGSASMSVSMTDLDGFTGNVAFGCSGLPSEAKCAFSPTSLSSTGSTNLTVTTTAPVGRLRQGLRGSQWSLAIVIFSAPAAGICLLVIPGKRRRRFLLAFILLGGVLVGCGGGGGNQGPPPNPGTPKGLYIVTITATSGANSHVIQFGLGVL